MSTIDLSLLGNEREVCERYSHQRIKETSLKMVQKKTIKSQTKCFNIDFIELTCIFDLLLASITRHRCDHCQKIRYLLLGNCLLIYLI